MTNDIFMSKWSFTCEGDAKACVVSMKVINLCANKIIEIAEFVIAMNLFQSLVD